MSVDADDEGLSREEEGEVTGRVRDREEAEADSA